MASGSEAAKKRFAKYNATRTAAQSRNPKRKA